MSANDKDNNNYKFNNFTNVNHTTVRNAREYEKASTVSLQRDYFESQNTAVVNTSKKIKYLRDIHESKDLNNQANPKEAFYIYKDTNETKMKFDYPSERESRYHKHLNTLSTNYNEEAHNDYKYGKLGSSIYTYDGATKEEKKINFYKLDNQVDRLNYLMEFYPVYSQKISNINNKSSNKGYINTEDANYYTTETGSEYASRDFYSQRQSKNLDKTLNPLLSKEFIKKENTESFSYIKDCLKTEVVEKPNKIETKDENKVIFTAYTKTKNSKENVGILKVSKYGAEQIESRKENENTNNQADKQVFKEGRFIQQKLSSISKISEDNRFPQGVEKKQSGIDLDLKERTSKIFESEVLTITKSIDRRIHSRLSSNIIKKDLYTQDNDEMKYVPKGLCDKYGNFKKDLIELASLNKISLNLMHSLKKNDYKTVIEELKKKNKDFPGKPQEIENEKIEKQQENKPFRTFTEQVLVDNFNPVVTNFDNDISKMFIAGFGGDESIIEDKKVLEQNVSVYSRTSKMSKISKTSKLGKNKNDLSTLLKKEKLERNLSNRSFTSPHPIQNKKVETLLLKALNSPKKKQNPLDLSVCSIYSPKRYINELRQMSKKNKPPTKPPSGEKRRRNSPIPVDPKNKDFKKIKNKKKDNEKEFLFINENIKDNEKSETNRYRIPVNHSPGPSIDNNIIALANASNNNVAKNNGLTARVSKELLPIMEKHVPSADILPVQTEAIKKIQQKPANSASNSPIRVIKKENELEMIPESPYINTIEKRIKEREAKLLERKVTIDGIPTIKKVPTSYKANDYKDFQSPQLNLLSPNIDKYQNLSKGLAIQTFKRLNTENLEKPLKTERLAHGFDDGNSSLWQVLADDIGKTYDEIINYKEDSSDQKPIEKKYSRNKINEKELNKKDSRGLKDNTNTIFKKGVITDSDKDKNNLSSNSNKSFSENELNKENKIHKNKEADGYLRKKHIEDKENNYEKKINGEIQSKGQNHESNFKEPEPGKIKGIRRPRKEEDTLKHKDPDDITKIGKKSKEKDVKKEINKKRHSDIPESSYEEENSAKEKYSEPDKYKNEKNKENDKEKKYFKDKKKERNETKENEVKEDSIENNNSLPSEEKGLDTKPKENKNKRNNHYVKSKEENYDRVSGNDLKTPENPTKREKKKLKGNRKEESSVSESNSEIEHPKKEKDQKIISTYNYKRNDEEDVTEDEASQSELKDSGKNEKDDLPFKNRNQERKVKKKKKKDDEEVGEEEDFTQKSGDKKPREVRRPEAESEKKRDNKSNIYSPSKKETNNVESISGDSDYEVEIAVLSPNRENKHKSKEKLKSDISGNKLNNMHDKSNDINPKLPGSPLSNHKNKSSLKEEPATDDKLTENKKITKNLSNEQKPIKPKASSDKNIVNLINAPSPLDSNQSQEIELQTKGKEDEPVKKALQFNSTQKDFNKPKKSVVFTDRKLVVHYDSDKLITAYNMTDETGNPVRKPYMSFRQNQKTQFHTKPIIKEYEQPMDDEKERKEALAKLNDLINEFEQDEDSESPRNRTPRKDKPNLIVRNIRYVQEIEEQKKSGTKVVKRRRFVTPGKKKYSDLCKKFKEHPEKFFTTLPTQHYFETLNIRTGIGYSSEKARPKALRLTPVTKEFKVLEKKSQEVKNLNPLNLFSHSDNKFILDDDKLPNKDLDLNEFIKKVNFTYATPKSATQSSEIAKTNDEEKKKKLEAEINHISAIESEVDKVNNDMDESDVEISRQLEKEL